MRVRLTKPGPHGSATGTADNAAIASNNAASGPKYFRGAPNAEPDTASPADRAARSGGTAGISCAGPQC